MPGPRPDPFTVLGVSRDAPDAEIRRAYRRLVQLHHPDHNDGSPESERRFEEVQEAYGEVTRIRRSAPPPPRPGTPPPRAADPAVEARLADLEREVREAHEARERARRAAQEAAREAAQQAATQTAAQASSRASADGRRRPSDEELGYVHTDDSFSQLLADARSELASKIGEGLDQAQAHPVAKRVSDLIDDLAARLTGEGHRGSGGDS